MTERPATPHDLHSEYAEQDAGEAAGPFVWRASPDGQGVVLEGNCPRCHGRTATEIRRGLPGTGAKGIRDWLSGTPPRPAPAVDAAALTRERHFCECGHPHPQLPADAPFVGCGASWRVAVVLPGDVDEPPVNAG
ncbi:hypothetical protein AB0O76_20400 [Streptomyces sp. NPDC086554]|uniref:hypothetical protein n=1 Tax=Streptomyces sp. NPDC086554 TaxID=3154864 RepID=UPI00343D0E85